ALSFREKHPDRVHVVRFEDVVADPKKALGDVLAKLGVGPSDTLREPTWNGRKLDQVYPWGTIRTPSATANRATGEELSAAEREEVRWRTRPFLDALGYADFLQGKRSAA